MANGSTVLLTLKGNATQLNQSIGSAIKQLNTLVATANKVNTTATQAAPTGGIAGSLFNKQSMGVLAQGRGMIDSALSGLDKSVATVNRTFGAFQKGISAVGDSLRLTSQAVSTFGKMWSVLISAPVGMFLKQQASFAIEFENALVRVQKVTNLTTSQLRNFRDGLRDVAINTATSHMELVSIAEVIGQAGITSQKAILSLTETINMFSIATGIAADTAATDLIRMGNAFGWTEEEMADGVKRLGSVMNKLENTNAVTAAQVMRGTAAWAQNAEALGIAEHAAAALTGTLVAMGFSDSEAGTAMRRLTSGLLQNADAVVSAMKGVEGYSSAREVATSLDEDALGVLMDMISAAEAGESQALMLMETLEIGGVRGGRALAALASNTALLTKNLQASKNEWGEATSLVMEYELAMRSTKNQMALLKNNINDVGITLGDALLPTINELIMMLVPLIRQFNEFFKSLDDGTKRMVVLGAVGAVALGPVLFIFGQLANAVSLVFLGLGRLLLIIPNIFSAVVALIKPILLVGRFFLSWPGLVAAGVVGILKVLSNAGANIAGFFTDLGARAVAWGEKLAETYASGFMSGAVTFIVKALNWVANLIASFFRGASPPKVGPLSTIDKWGSKVMKAYLKGFLNADFSVLSSVGKIIEKTLTRGLEGKGLASALESVAMARLNLSKLIDTFNQTGRINNNLLNDITKNLGPITENVRSLIKHWLEYNRLQERIAQIEERRKEVKRTYMDELKAIAGTNMSMREKVEAIRAAQRARDDNLRGLSEEQALLEEQSAEEKAQVDRQKAMIDAMSEQDDLLQRIVDTLKQVADAMSGAGGAESLGGFGLPDPKDIPDPFEAMGEAYDTLEERLTKGKQMIQGFLDAFSGKDRKDFDMGPEWLVNADPETTGIINMYNKMYDIGEKAREIYDTLVSWKDAAVGFATSVWEAFQGITADIGIDISGDNIGDTISGLFDGFKNIPFISGLIEGFTEAFDSDAFQYIADAFEILKWGWNELVAAFSGGGGVDWKTIGSWVGEIFAIIINGAQYIVAAVTVIIGVILWWWSVFKNAYEWFRATASDIITSVKTILLAGWNQMITDITTFVTGVGEGFALIWSIIEEWAVGVVASATQAKDDFVAAIEEGIASLLESWEQAKTDAETAWDQLKTAVLEKADEVVTDTTAKIQLIIDFIVDSALTMFSAGSDFIAGLWNGFKAKWTAVEEWAKEKFAWLANLFNMEAEMDSPSKLMFESGMNFMKGLQGGLKGGFIGVENTLDSSYDALLSRTLIPTGVYNAGLPTQRQDIRNIEVTINDPVVRSDQDIDDLVRRVSEVLARKINNKINYGGQTFIA